MFPPNFFNRDDDNATDSNPSEGNNCPSPSTIGTPPQGKKSVRWFDEEEASDHTDSSDSETERNIQPGKGTGNRENLGVIHFTHSSVVPCLTEVRFFLNSFSFVSILS